jgi:hypothetical protein
MNVSNVRLLTMPGFKGGLLNLGIRTAHIEIFDILNGFRPELKAKTRVFKNRYGFIIEGLTKVFYGTIYL